MPRISIDIPARFMPVLTKIAQEELELDTATLTNAQIAQKVSLKIIKQAIKTYRENELEVTSKLATMKLVNQAQADLAASKAILETDIEAIVEV